MHCRPYQSSDLPSLVDIHISCAPTDSLAQFLNNDLVKYRASHRVNIYNFLRGRTLGIGIPPNVPFIMQVVETDDIDYVSSNSSQAPQVIGFAFWYRIGTSKPQQEWKRNQSKDSWTQSLNKALVTIESKYYSFFPSILPSQNMDNFTKLGPGFRRQWDPEVFAEAWVLDHVFIHQDWQRKGLGRKLMKWGFEQAQKEKVPVLVKGSAIGGSAYRAAGFRPLYSMNFGRFFDETRFGGESLQAWVWEPKLEEGDGIEGRWLERAKLKLRMAEKPRPVPEVL